MDEKHTEALFRSATVTWADPSLIYAAHREMSSLDFFRATEAGELPIEPAMSLFGAWIERVNEGEAVLALDIEERHLDHTGCLQPGILAALTDSAAGYAVHTMLPLRGRAASVEFHVSVIEPIRLQDRRIVVAGRSIHVGRRTATCEASVTNEAGVLKATMGMTMMVLPADSA
jgi:uncharacterized protein (TIGR00369 family)